MDGVPFFVAVMSSCPVLSYYFGLVDHVKRTTGIRMFAYLPGNLPTDPLRWLRPMLKFLAS